MNALSGRVEPSETWRMEQFSRAYIAAVAAGAACSMARPEVDDDSVDLILMRKTIHGLRRSPRLELQIKSTSVDCIEAEAVKFPLEIKNYNELRATHFVLPRILVVVVMPDDIMHGLDHDETRLALKKCGYWVSLIGAPPTANTTSITISLPRSQVFGAQALDQIFTRLVAGGMP
jgi:hypothetical protein